MVFQSNVKNLIIRYIWLIKTSWMCFQYTGSNPSPRTIFVFLWKKDPSSAHIRKKHVHLFWYYTDCLNKAISKLGFMSYFQINRHSPLFCSFIGPIDFIHGIFREYSQALCLGVWLWAIYLSTACEHGCERSTTFV